MFYNEGGLEVAYDVFREPIEIPPKFLGELYFGVSSTSVSGISAFKTIKSPVPYYEKANTIVFYRQFALGDVLMLLPVARQFRKHFPGKKLILIASGDIVKKVEILNDGAFDEIHNEAWLRSRGPSGYDLGIHLNRVVEQDIFQPTMRDVPRITLYQDFMGLPREKEMDWGPYEFDGNPSGAVLASAGSKVMKKIPQATVEYLMYYLGRKFSKVMLVDDQQRVPFNEVVAALKKARVIVTVDSAPLWMAHFTRTPTVLVSGFARGSVRLHHHPLQPEGSESVDFAAEVGCEPCFESMEKCGRKVSCMNDVSPQRAWQLIEGAIERVSWKTREI